MSCLPAPYQNLKNSRNSSQFWNSPPTGSALVVHEEAVAVDLPVRFVIDDSLAVLDLAVGFVEVVVGDVDDRRPPVGLLHHQLQHLELVHDWQMLLLTGASAYGDEFIRHQLVAL